LIAPAALGEAVQQDAARWQADIVRKFRSARVTRATTPAEAADQRNLRILLDRVKKFWVDGVLERSVQGVGLLELDKEKQQDAVEHPWRNLVKFMDHVVLLNFFQRVGSGYMFVHQLWLEHFVAMGDDVNSRP